MVDLGGYVMVLIDHNGKLKLYGSTADNADRLEVGDEILEVNGCTLENATHEEVTKHIKQCIMSRTICLRVRRRSGNKMEELDGVNLEQIRDAWIIAVERGAKERLQRLTALRSIQPKDIQAILHEQISKGAASTSGAETGKEVTNGQITVTLSDKEHGTYPTKLSNGTIPKGIVDRDKDSSLRERKDTLEKQQSCPEEANLLQPLQSARSGERRASSPFQNGRTEVLIGEPEGGPRSPRGSTSSSTSRSRRRSGSGVADIHLQQAQLQENNNSSRETAKEGLGPDEMWAPAALSHHRELPVDVPDTLLQQAYPNKVKTCSPGYRRRASERDRHRPRSASELDLSLNLRNKSGEGAIVVAGAEERSGELVRAEEPARIELKIEGSNEDCSVNGREKSETEEGVIARTTEPELGRNGLAREDKESDEEEEEEGVAKEEKDEERAKQVRPEVIQHESSVDIDEDYPFAKEDYPTMLKTCSDDSASPRSSSGRSDSTAPLDTSLVLCSTANSCRRGGGGGGGGESSPLYDARRIDLGSPCRPIISEIKITPLFGRAAARDNCAASFDNPAYGLQPTDHPDIQGLLMRSDEVTDLTRLIDEGGAAREPPVIPIWSILATDGAQVLKKSFKRQDERSRRKSGGGPGGVEGLIKAGSPDERTEVELGSGFSSRLDPFGKSKKRRQQTSSGYSTLRSDASTADLESEPPPLFRVVDADTAGDRVFREVAVDCPPDFVPVTKCHPVYPPPRRSAPRRGKCDSLENTRVARPKSLFERAASTTFAAGADRRDSGVPEPADVRGTTCTAREVEKDSETTNNDRFRLPLPLPDSHKEPIVVDKRTVAPRGDKVRSKVKSLLSDSFTFGHRKPLAACSTAPRCSSSNNKNGTFDRVPLFENRKRHSFAAPRVRDATNPFRRVLSPQRGDDRSSSYSSSSSRSVATAAALFRSTENLLEKSFERNCSSCENPRLDVSREVEDAEPGSSRDALEPPEKRAASPVGLEMSRFTRETLHNSLNSYKELVSSRGLDPTVRCLPKEGGRPQLPLPDDARKSSVNSLYTLDGESTSAQNRQNSKLALEYRCASYLDLSLPPLRDESASRDDLKVVNDAPLSKSELDLSGPLDLSISKVHSWLSDPYLVPKSVPDPKHSDTIIPKNHSACTTTTTPHNCTNKHAPPTPPPRPPVDTPENSVYDSVHPYEDVDDFDDDQTGLNGVKPAIPPRDQKRAPARPPKDNLRLSAQNNNVEQSDNANTEPTQQQLHSIRKYQEQLRKRKDEEEKQEVLNRSLRDSRKLQALESHATSLSGQENPAYAQDEPVSIGRARVAPTQVLQEVEEPPRPLTYGEVVATLERLQLQLRNISGALGISGPGVEAELEAVRTLLIQRRFATALATHHALKNRLRTGKAKKPHAEDASNLARDCIDVLEQWQSSVNPGTGGETSAAVEELTSLLTSYEMEGLLLSHDSIVSYVDGLQRKQSSSSSSPSEPPSPSSSMKDSRIADNFKVIKITIEKTNEPLGATVRNEGDAVIIGRIVRGGAADKSGLLHEGDEVLEVNKVEMRGKSVNEVCDILAGMQGSLTFLIHPTPTNHRNNLTNNRREDNTQIQHVKAHFDYDPEEDLYIPCRELGVSFKKGDILHVISQDDPNWWQAYREGEEDQTLAGLIPSREFQQRRESMKQTIAGDKSTARGAKKSSTLLCARKNPKKKKRSKFEANFNDDGYTLYATTAIDDYDSEEVLTYEEVALYYPRANHKRPVVLIGPPNIGRHEFRQRLMQDSERFAAAIPHTSRPRKESEVDGQDYHFISRPQFESDILCQKFVEHGEYEKAYYGTSVEAIKSVVNSGKICVLNLHPQSLKILRSSDLKPYVVFVAPPSLEKLRQKRLNNNESFKEEELKDIIEKAREMEDKYGHLFDTIIINKDTDQAYNKLLSAINSLEREPQWVPASWVK